MAAAAAAAGGAGGGGSAALGDGGAIDYSVHEAWNEATNVYLLVVLASLALLVYARRNKRRIMRIFTLPPAAETPPGFYDSLKKRGSTNSSSSHRNRLKAYSCQWSEAHNRRNSGRIAGADDESQRGATFDAS
ncbi:small integral membrane protein 19 isoform X1 [Opisthocomus hoazin]|uniref:small integral membrane protein 19 isoform X1 n=1 Tax=Opisthocomus hoazin TaxID=30419 RepID=UPI003F52FA12